ncbi:MAG: hypothetical protein N4A49_11555 [Marinifilaceae bacterium]|jgi:hypothetical protein|nr:hypothetical protein [Marinifilaceae bacterium]
MNKTEQILELQNRIVLEFNTILPYNWEMLILNLEVVEGSNNTPITNRICFCIYTEKEILKTMNKSIPIELEDLLLDLRKLKENWDICDLSILSNGVFEFNFSYDGVKRLNGVFDNESMFRFDNHIDEYKRRLKYFA